MSQKKIIITGGPGFGKTSLVNELEIMGHGVVHEVARAFIKDQLEKKSNIVPWIDIEKFSRHILPIQIANYTNTYQPITFFDRGIPDIQGYLSAQNNPTFDELAKAIANHRYHHEVFVTPPWEEIYKADKERKESLEEAIHVHQNLVNTYKKHDYTIIEIPLLSIKERAKFILDRV